MGGNEKHFSRSFFLYLTVFFIIALFFVSCPGRISDEDVFQVKDAVEPQIIIISPEEGSSYAAMVVVTGIVIDSSSESGDEGGMKSLLYEVLNTSIEDNIDFDSNGGFSFYFSTAGLSGSIVVRISATDWNENESSVLLTLLDEGAVPSFTAEPGHRQVKLTWEPIPFAESYSLYYTTDGSYPSEYYGIKIDDVSSPYTLENLENGAMHVFQLHAHSSEGEDNWSDYQKAIPLATTTLVPFVESNYDSVELTWKDMPGAEDDGFEVLRSTERNGNYIPIRGNLHSSSYTDSRASDTRGYFYKIRPAAADSIESEPQYGNASPFPENKASRRGTCTTYDAKDVAVLGNYAYVADSEGGLKVIDTSNPDAPYLVGVCDKNIANAEAVAVYGSYAFIADRDDVAGGLKVVDVDSGSSTYLQVVGSCSAPQACDVVLSENGTKAYIVYRTYGLMVVDISEPLNVDDQSGTNIISVTSPNGVAVSDDYAYVAAYGGVKVINLITGSQEINIGTSSWPYAIVVNGDYAYVADGDVGLRIIDIKSGSPTYRQVIGTCDTRSLWGYAWDVAVSGNFAYVAEWEEGVKVVNVTDRTNPTLIGSCPADVAYGIKLSGAIAYLADGPAGFKAFDIALPSSPTSAGSCTQTEVRDIKVSGDYAYVVGGGGGLKIIDLDIDSATYLEVVESCPLTYAPDISVSGNYAYVAAGDDGLKIIDIDESSSTYMTVVGTWDKYGVAYVAAYESYAYTAPVEGGLKVIDISTPNTPVGVGGYGTIWPEEIVVRGNYAYIAQTAGSVRGLTVMDISDPLSFIEVGFCDTGNAFDVAISGDYAFVAAWSFGLKVIDISDPMAVEGGDPSNYDDGSVIATLSTINASSVEVSGGYAYVTGSGLLNIVDISDPQNMSVLSGIPISNVYSVAVSGSHAYVAAGSGGLVVVDLLTE